MHKKIPKICTGCRVSEAKIYLYHSTEIAKARPHSEEWQTYTSVQKQWSMHKYSRLKIIFACLYYMVHTINQTCMKGFETYTERTRGGPGQNDKKINHILGHYNVKIRAFPEQDPL